MPKPAPASANRGVRCWAAVSVYAPFPERINQIEPLLREGHRQPISDVPAVVQFDGIWLRVQIQSDTIKLDKRQRKRHQRTGKKVVRLFALGFWTAGLGKREILDWPVADNEGQTAWEPLVNRLS